MAPGTDEMVGKAPSGTRTDALTSAVKVRGSTKSGANDWARSLRNTWLDPAEDNDNPPRPVLDFG